MLSDFMSTITPSYLCLSIKQKHLHSGKYWDKVSHSLSTSYSSDDFLECRVRKERYISDTLHNHTQFPSFPLSQDQNLIELSESLQENCGRQRYF